MKDIHCYFCYQQIFMRTLSILGILICALSSCSNSGKNNAFCDTTCKSDSIKFKGDEKFKSYVAIGMKNCKPDTLIWAHYLMDFEKNIDLPSFLDQDIRINPSAISCVIKDTSVVWLTFNDCITGRGYLLKLPFAKNGTIGKYTGAINSFDPKFSVTPNLRAYTDRGSVFVVNIDNGKEASMSFKENYANMDFNKIHETIDSVNITAKKIYVKLLKDGGEVPLEKSVDLE